MDVRTLDENERAQLEKLFETVIRDAAMGKCWPPRVYVENVQAVIDGFTLEFEPEMCSSLMPLRDDDVPEAYRYQCEGYEDHDGPHHAVGHGLEWD